MRTISTLLSSSGWALYASVGAAKYWDTSSMLITSKLLSCVLAGLIVTMMHTNTNTQIS